MELKRLSEWLSTAEGAFKRILAVVSMFGSIVSVATNVLQPIAETLAVPKLILNVGGISLAFGLAVLLWLDFRRFALASRLELPETFNLRPIEPGALIGRSNDLSLLLNAVNRNRVVLLDGESGCGKSAMITAGLVPQMQEENGLLPVLIRDWGDDWVRGPLSGALEALYVAIPDDERERLGWLPRPDLAADSQILERDLELRLTTVFNQLGRRTLLIADQFDDYQSLHHKRFIDDQGNWIAPSDLAATNAFWALVSRGLDEGRLHLLVTTRADMGSGLTCVGFLPNTQTVARRLFRVEPEFVRPLLNAVAPDSSQAVSNPANGWHELRERLAHDLRADGSVLMQQVRAVLQGVRQLPLLTVSSYQNAGGVRGVETLFISRSLSRAASAAGGGEAGLRIARGIVSIMVLHGADQLPKARRAAFSELARLAATPIQAEIILRSLQLDEVVRPAERVAVLDDHTAWQLDHDYLVHPILAEARDADRWAVALRERREKHEQVRWKWLSRWRTLLPVDVFVRVCWERFRGRLVFGASTDYVKASAIRVALAIAAVVAMGALAYMGYEDRLLTARAVRLIDKFGGSDQDNAVMEVWRAPHSLRHRVYTLVTEDESRLERACASRWPFAHAGLEIGGIREAVEALGRLQRARQSRGMFLATSYAEMALRMSDSAELAVAASVLRENLPRDSDRVAEYASAYAVMVPRITDIAELKAGAAALRSELENASSWRALELTKAYAAVVLRLRSSAEAKFAASALRKLVSQAHIREIAAPIEKSYAQLVGLIEDAGYVKTELSELRQDLGAGEQLHGYAADCLVKMHSVLLGRLGAEDIRTEASLLAARIENGTFSESLVRAYAALASQLGDSKGLSAMALSLRTQLQDAPDSTYLLVRPYAVLVTYLGEGAEFRAALKLLGHMVSQTNDPRSLAVLSSYSALASQLEEAELLASAAVLKHVLKSVPSYAYTQALEAYAAVAARFSDAGQLQSDAAMLRAALQKEDQFSKESIVEAYAAIALRLAPAAMRQEVRALRLQLYEVSQRKDPSQNVEYLAKAYGAVAPRLQGGTDIKAEVVALGAVLRKAPRAYQKVLADSYAAVVGRLQDVEALARELKFLRSRMQAATYGEADALVPAYTAVAATLAARTGKQERQGLTRELLVLSAHPFVSNQQPFFPALEASAGESIGVTTAATAEKLERVVGVTAAQLRPSLLQLETR